MNWTTAQRIVFAMFLVATVSLTASLSADSPQEVVFNDDFQDAKLKGRRALRGDWKIADGVAKCTQDDELYKKYKDHGPIIFYDLGHTDAVIWLKYQADGCKTVVFTVNGENGHVFRFITSDRGTNLRAFPPDGEAKSIALHVDREKVLTADEWTDVKVALQGSKASVQVGDGEPFEVEHPSLARPKTNISIGFSFGTLAVSEFSVR